MNLNDIPDELKKEEQRVLNALIDRMSHIINHLDAKMKEYIEEAREADITVNSDLYLSKLLARKGIEDTAENRDRMLHSRDELYRTRLLLHYSDETEGEEGVEEVKVGLHSCINGEERLVTSWKNPICRHYMLDNSSTEFRHIVKDKLGEYHTDYKLLVKNQVELRFTHITKASNVFPGIFDEDAIQMLRDTGFFSEEFLDSMLRRFNPDDYDAESAEQFISDEFLQELLERRSSPEFKNIVFSIQKKQGELIQAPYERNMIVQGCAGSGKSMIMMHRLPVLLYDHPNNLNRTNLYIITPSQMYVQMAETMRHQLEISDINMGTIEQYYDHCIEKFSGHKAGEYGKISHSIKVRFEDEQYIYSKTCISDIKQYFEEIIDSTEISLESACFNLQLEINHRNKGKSYAQEISLRLSDIQKVVSKNNEVVLLHFTRAKDAVECLEDLVNTLRNRKINALREIVKMNLKRKEEVRQAQSIKKVATASGALDTNGTVFLQNGEKKLLDYRDLMEDTDYFNSLIKIGDLIDSKLKMYSSLKKDFDPDDLETVCKELEELKTNLKEHLSILEDIGKIEDKYSSYAGAISDVTDKATHSIVSYQAIQQQYLEKNYLHEVLEVRDILVKENAGAVKAVYEQIMEKIGIKKNESGILRAGRCSPYLYLQILYQFQGIPSYYIKDSLLAIDEAQGIAPEELNLLKKINGGGTVFNLYGDINQHIEGTKGIDDWKEYDGIIDYDLYEMKENYRNASQITDYCNVTFGMDMTAINTPGKGVHEMVSDDEFHSEMITQLMDEQRVGLGAILVGNDAEARYIMGEFSEFENKFHDMTREDFSVDRIRWNIINIDDAKGLEFSSVIVLSGRMSRNQKYIAYTRALDDLYVYKSLVDVKNYEKKKGKRKEDSNIQDVSPVNQNSNNFYHEKSEQSNTEDIKKGKDYSDSAVRAFFEKRGLKVIDNRNQGGRLWVLGERTDIANIINEAMDEFDISGKYATSNEIGNRPGWCSKTEK